MPATLLTLALVAAVEAATEGPCDILGAAGNACVAAHSTVRALYAKYDGPLYNVTRASDGKSANIGLLTAGGFANAKQQDAFCTAGDCVISNVFDQSPNGNHLGRRHKLVNASRHPLIVGSGVPVYGMWFDPGFGYHVDKTTGVATGNDPESIYAVMSGTHYNGGCCFDYGNSEVNDRDDGCGTMEAIYFGNAHWKGNSGAGKTGPWMGADLEQGMYYGGGNVTKVNPQSQPLTSEFVTGSVKGRSDGFTIKGGDATQGTLTTMYDGPRPDPKIAGTCGKTGTYQPMRKQGAIILATGGDNSNRAEGNFYEGFMATGFASDATDAAIQANIIAVGYKNLKAVAGEDVLVAERSGNATCGNTSYCCPDAKKCVSPLHERGCDPKTADELCGIREICCPLTQMCVIPGADCVAEPVCGADAYCCPDAKKCATPVKDALIQFCDPGDKEACSFHAGAICCPLIKQCVTLGAACSA